METAHVELARTIIRSKCAMMTVLNLHLLLALVARAERRAQRKRENARMARMARSAGLEEAPWKPDTPELMNNERHAKRRSLQITAG